MRLHLFLGDVIQGAALGGLPSSTIASDNEVLNRRPMPKPLPRFLFRLKQMHVQLAACAAAAALVQSAIYYGKWTRVDISAVDRSTYISALSAVATVVALFCSLSIAWILFVSQQSRSERVTTYDLIKARLLEVQHWLLNLERSVDREVCLAYLYELEKLQMEDLPCTDYGPTYDRYLEALDAGLDSDDVECREFYLISSTHFAYIEQLFNRIGLISIRQYVSIIFIRTLAKGVALAALSVLVLICAVLWYGEATSPAFVIIAAVLGVASTLLLLEVWVDVLRNYREEIDFVDGGDDDAPAAEADPNSVEA